MARILRAVLLTSLFSLSLVARAQSDEVDDPTYLDGFVGIGGSLLQGITSQSDVDDGSEIEKGTRELIRVEFTRVRKHISLEARVGVGNGYTDFGGLFRAYKHWKFGPESTTGISLGMGAGAMYSQGRQPQPGDDRQPFADIIFAPFVRYIWDWGNGAGLAFDLEYQLVPYTMYTQDDETDNFDDIKTIRSRVMLGVTFLFEVD